MKILETDRLVLRRLSADDDAFYLQLVNDPSWLRFIGDRGIRTVEQARDALVKGPVAMHDALGFSLYLTELKDGAVPIGICGLIKRDTLKDVDIGFAFLPGFRGQGYAFESAAAVMAHAQHTLALPRVVAITNPENASSIKLLERLGLRFQERLQLTDHGAPTALYARDFRPG